MVFEEKKMMSHFSAGSLYTVFEPHPL
jgi:hypothetical protein